MLNGAMMQCSSGLIIQWNLNGLRARLAHLQSLISLEQPKIIALQELKMNADQPLYLRNFVMYKLCRVGVGGGGVCLAVHTSLPSVPLQLNSDLEAVACKVFFKDTCLNICCVYFNNAANVCATTLRDLVASHAKLFVKGPRSLTIRRGCIVTQ